MSGRPEFQFKYPLQTYRADDIYLLAPHETGENESLIRVTNHVGDRETIAVFATHYDARAAEKRARDLITAARALVGEKP